MELTSLIDISEKSAKSDDSATIDNFYAKSVKSDDSACSQSFRMLRVHVKK